MVTEEQGKKILAWIRATIIKEAQVIIKPETPHIWADFWGVDVNDIYPLIFASLQVSLMVDDGVIITVTKEKI